MNSWNTVNIFVNIFGSLLFIKYLCDSMPMESKLLNKLEIISYINLLFFWYFLFLYTEYINDVEMRYELGYVYIYMIIFVISINLILISKSIITDSLFEYKKKKSKDAWKKFAKLKVRMAKFIVDKSIKHAKEAYGIDHPVNRKK
jgi:hypothetical protein